MRPQALLAALFVATALTGLSGCSSILDCVDGSGEVTSEERNLPAFHSIVIEGSMDVYLTQDTVQNVRIEAESNIIDLITTEVTDNVLVLDTRECYSSTPGVKVHISIPDIHRLQVDGSGDFFLTSQITAGTLHLQVDGSGDFLMMEPVATDTLLIGVDGSGKIMGEDRISAGGIWINIDGSGDIGMDVDADSIATKIDGSGNIELLGLAGKHTVDVNGSGDILALDMPTAEYDISVDGSGNSRIHVTEKLKVRIGGSGDVYYKGDPPDKDIVVTGAGDVIKL